jgi:CubicO group peptidase (beta-lactamase class C family)
MNDSIRFLCACFLLLGICIPLAADGANPGGPEDPDIARVEQGLLPYHIITDRPAYRLSDRMEHYGVPGLSIAVIEDFEVRWVKCYGVPAVATGVPVDENTLFNVGSLSKAMAAAVTLSLVQQGRIDLDGDVNRQLKSWQVPPNDFTAQAPVTPRLLMNHSAGLPHRPPFSYTADKLPTTMQMINGLPPSRSTPLRVTRRPGEGFQYSNGGFTVLQILAEDVTGLPFDQAARQQVFVPLGLEHATFTTPLPAELMARAASGHRPDGSPYSAEPLWMSHTAAGGLWITVGDYARFVIEIQKSLHGESNRLFSAELTDEMLSPHAADIYGLGVFLYEGSGSEPFFSHIGDGPGFVAGFTSHRSQGFGAVVTTNGQGGINLCREVLRAVASVYDWPGYLPAERREMPLSAVEIERFSGRYRLGLDTVVSLDDGGGFLELKGEGMPGFRLFRIAADTLVCCERKGELAIGVEPDGGRPYLDLHLSDDIGRLGDEIHRGRRMAPAERTPLEMILAGEFEPAIAEYLKYQEGNPGDAQIAESRFNRLGYRLLGQENPDGALAVFRLNTLLYPDSSNVFDSYGEALLAVGRRTEAVANYRKSLELNPGNTNAADVLKTLEVETVDR